MDWLMCVTPFRECPDCKPPSGFMQRVKQFMVLAGIELPGGAGIIQHSCPVCGYKTPSDERIERLKAFSEKESV